MVGWHQELNARALAAASEQWVTVHRLSALDTNVTVIVVSMALVVVVLVIVAWFSTARKEAQCLPLDTKTRTIASDDENALLTPSDPFVKRDSRRSIKDQIVQINELAEQMQNNGAAFRRCEDADDEDDFELPDGYFEISAEDIIGNMGLSGMALLDPSKSSGINGLPLRFSLPFIAVQAWALQGIILYYMYQQLTPRPSVSEIPKLPFAIVFAAVYLHFINCTTDLPFAFMAMRHIHEFHHELSDLVICGPIFAVDGLVVPLCSLVIGSWYLCTSATIGDVILNSCAVAFIGNIDNFILEMNARMNSMAGNSENLAFQSKLFVPVNLPLIKSLNWLMCVVPVVPAVAACGLIHIGALVFKI